jgi:hypothetical protein
MSEFQILTWLTVIAKVETVNHQGQPRHALVLMV